VGEAPSRPQSHVFLASRVSGREQETGRGARTRARQRSADRAQGDAGPIRALMYKPACSRGLSVLGEWREGMR
jgi:hypothetical protein